MPGKKHVVRQAAIVSSFAEKLKEHRSAKGITQRDLAKKAEITLTYVSRLEAAGAAPGIDTLERLAGALGVEIMELLPPPKQQKTVDTDRREVKELFESLLPKMGQETLAMLGSLLKRLADASALKK
jgi:transcriptional regulator with XRE-family HTH domain